MAGKSRPQEEVIKDFIEVHGNKYDYSKVTYTGVSKNIIIICPIHGDFYNYDKVEYIKGVSSVTITCPIHGDFPQTPSSHKAGKGCHKCAIEISSGWTHTNWQKAGEKSKNFDSFKVYILRCWNDQEEFYKIGKTFKKVKDRFNAKSHMPYNYETILEEIFENAKEASIREISLKSKNRDIKYIPSIYFRGIQECFSKNPCTTKNKYIHL